KNDVSASRTKDYFAPPLLRDHPEIVSIAPRLKLDGQGRPTSKAVIVIGVRKIGPLRFGPGTVPRPPAAPLPDKLPVITPEGTEDRTQFIEVLIEDEGEIVLESNTAKRRPCPGG